MPPRILHVDLDAFFVEVCRQRNPGLREVELLVVGGRRDQRGVVQSASYGARRYGVRSGMPIAQAARLCPGATFHQGAFADYRDASLQVAGVLRQFSPTVVMASLDEAYLDFTGTELLYPVSLLPVAEELRRAVHAASGLDCSIGIGPNRMVAKLASDAAKPRGLLEVRPGWEEGFLAGLELRALPGIGPRSAQRLADRGLTGVWQVQGMSLEELRRVLGDEAAGLKRRAHGQASARLTPHASPKSISRETTLGRDAVDPARLEKILALFAARVGAQLRGEGLTARTVTLKLRHGDFRTITRSRTLETATDLDPELLSAARALFGPAFAEARRRDQGIRLIGLGATNLQPADPPDLFEPEARRRARELTRAVDRVREKYGFDAVQRAITAGTRERGKGGRNDRRT